MVSILNTHTSKQTNTTTMTTKKHKETLRGVGSITVVFNDLMNVQLT